MFSPIKQDESKATFCYKIKKKDGIVDLLDITAIDLYNLYRAYITFPKVTISNALEPFGEGVRLVDCRYIEGVENIEKINELIFKDSNSKIYLKCKNDTFLNILIIMDKNGKKIDLKGYNF